MKFLERKLKFTFLEAEASLINEEVTVGNSRRFEKVFKGLF